MKTGSGNVEAPVGISSWLISVGSPNNQARVAEGSRAPILVFRLVLLFVLIMFLSATLCYPLTMAGPAMR